jgi:hypothetical protein
MSVRRKIATVVAGASIAAGAAGVVALVHPIQFPHISFGAEQANQAPEPAGAPEATNPAEAPETDD